MSWTDTLIWAALAACAAVVVVAGINSWRDKGDPDGRY